MSEEARAAQSELRLREGKGELLNQTGVKRASFNAAALLNSSLSGLGPRLGPQLAMRRVGKIEEILTAELRALVAQYFEELNRLVPEGSGLDVDQASGRASAGSWPTARTCNSRPLVLAPLIIRFGDYASSDVISKGANARPMREPWRDDPDAKWGGASMGPRQFSVHPVRVGSETSSQ